jgi:hypothetical protein
MTRRTGVAFRSLVGLAAVASLLMVGQVQGAKPKADVPLKASFRSLTGDPGTAGTEAYYVDKILNDAMGPYTTNRNGVSVWLTGNNGDLFFRIEHHSARSVQVIFPYFQDPETGWWLPNTAGIYADLPKEPVDFFKLQTYNSSAYAAPKVNFLTMKAGDDVPVRLWTTICTTQRHYFFMNYAKDVGTVSGVVRVRAFDNGSDDYATRWEIYPDPATVDVAKIWKQSDSGQNVFYYFLDAPMPFLLTLQK